MKYFFRDFTIICILFQPGRHDSPEYAGAQCSALRRERNWPGVHESSFAEERDHGGSWPRAASAHGHSGWEAIHVLPGLWAHRAQAASQGELKSYLKSTLKVTLNTLCIYMVIQNSLYTICWEVRIMTTINNHRLSNAIMRCSTMEIIRKSIVMHSQWQELMQIYNFPRYFHW